jgi:uncharacterized cupin superfamily protein
MIRRVERAMALLLQIDARGHRVRPGLIAQAPAGSARSGQLGA